MERLTDRTEKGHAYLVNVKPDEQEVDSPYKNTLQCILDCFERLAAYEDTTLEPVAVERLIRELIKLACESIEREKMLAKLEAESAALAQAMEDKRLVKVVRCGECRYRKLAKVNCKGYTICPASRMEITDDDYCSYGERRERE